jgi:hypothetical protein
MLILGSEEHMMWARPRPVTVLGVARGSGRWLKQNALIQVPADGPGVDRLAATRRTARRWRIPHDGRKVEILIWDCDLSPAGFVSEGFDPPGTGASICWMMDVDLETETAAFKRRHGGRYT